MHDLGEEPTMALIKDITLAIGILLLLVIAFLAGFYMQRSANAHERASGSPRLSPASYSTRDSFGSRVQTAPSAGNWTAPMVAQR
jgi:hypothetical protein